MCSVSVGKAAAIMLRITAQHKSSAVSARVTTHATREREGAYLSLSGGETGAIGDLVLGVGKTAAVVTFELVSFAFRLLGV